MDHNPYTPPQANTEISIPREGVPRPIAVWLLIALLLVFVLVSLTATVRFIGVVTSHWGEIRDMGLLAVSLVWRLGLIAIALVAAYSAYRRRRWTRWLGVALLVAFAAFTAFRSDTTQYANDAERAGGHIARFVVVPLLVTWWIYALAFSSKARRYFSKSPSNTS